MRRAFLVGFFLCRAQHQIVGEAEYGIHQNQNLIGADEQALLQARVKVRMPQKETASSLLETVQDLALSVKSESPDTVRALVASITATIHGMRPLLRAEHTAAQSSIDAQLAEIDSCSGNSTHGTGAVTDAENDLAKEIAVMTACYANQSAAASSRDSACDAWKSHARSTYSAFPTSLSSSPDPDHVLSNMQEWKSFVEDLLPDMISKKAACTAATAQYAAAEAICLALKVQHDEAFCDHQGKCTFLHGCHRHEVSVYQSLNASSQMAVAARQGQFRTLAQVECLLGLITTAVDSNSTMATSNMSSCDKNAAVDEFVLSVKTPKTLSACPIPKWDDPQCPAVPMPPLWASGGAEHTLVMEFCKGPRKGKQYKLTLPNRPENSVSTLPSISGQTRMDWQSSYCYDGTNTTNGQWLAWSCNGYHDPNVQAGRVVRVKPADPECKDAPMNSDMTLSIGQCGANFAGWVRKRYLKPEPGTRWMTWYGWPRYLPASMIAAGGVGWDIFETIENDEDYKFVSGPSCPALREAKTGGTPVALSGLQGKNFTWGSVRDHVYEYIKSGDYSGKDEIFDSPGQKSCSGECANIDLRLAGHMPKQWFAYEFAQPTNIAEYSWQTMESECPARWDVQSSLDGTTWTHVSSESGQQCGSWDSATKTGVWQNYTTGTERKALHWRWKFVEYSPEGRADGYRLGSIRFSGIDPPPAHIR